MAGASSDISGTEGEPFSASPDLDGGFIGGHVAGLWQFDQAVIGAVAELNYASIDGTTELGPGNTFGTDIKWLGSVNAKAGYAMDRFLLYGVGGIAFAGIETSQNAGTSFATHAHECRLDRWRRRRLRADRPIRRRRPVSLLRFPLRAL